MKRFITAMLFSLTVIVCEQQTLFAPHYTDYGGTSLVASDTRNSLVPIAGVNRSVPLSGTSNYCGAPKCAPSRFKLLGAATESNPAKDLSAVDPIDGPRVSDPGTGKWNDCPPYEPCDDPAFHDDGAFLPWHREFVY